MKPIRRAAALLTAALILSACGPNLGTSAPAVPSPAATSVIEPVETQPQPPIQNAAPSFNRSIRFEHISLEQGLSQSVINVIHQDSKGFLWFGTEDGLNRFDGYSFKVYRPAAENETSLSNSWITAIVEDQNGFIWIGTRQGGLNRFDPRSGLFTVFKHDPGDSLSLSNNRVNTLFIDQNGALWAGTDSDLDRFNPADESFIHYIGSEGGLGNPVTAIYQSSSGLLWAGVAGNGLYQLDEKTNLFKTFQTAKSVASLSDNNITAITEDLEGNLWIATQNGLNRFKANTQTFVRYLHNPEDPVSISNNDLHDLHLDHNGVLWVGSSNGLDIYNAQLGHFIHYRHEPANPASLSNNTILSIFEDRGGVMWVGTFGGGLNKYNRRQDEFAYYRSDPANPKSLSGNLLSSIFAESNGTVWIGTLENGLNRFSPTSGEFKQYHHDPADPESLSSDQVYSTLVDRHGLLWVGTAAALDLFDPETGKSRRYIPADDSSGISGLPVNTIFEGLDGMLWIGTNNGLDQFNPSTGTFTHYRHNPINPNSLSDNHISAIEEDLQGSLWIGTLENGLNRFNRQRGIFTRYQNRRGDQKSLSNDAILSIHQSRDGNIWVGTAGGGLNRYDIMTDSFTSFTEKDGLPNNVIYGILEDRENHLWLSTNYGLSRFDPQLTAFRNYTVSDGLQSNEFNSNAHAVTPRGEMYFGGINGLNFFDPLSAATDDYIPPIVLTSLTQNGEPIAGAVRVESLQEVTLRWPLNSFEFEFAALAYGQPGKNQYAYKLENFDDEWNLIGAKHSSRYTNLPGGTYSLLLKGSNSDGMWNETPLQIRVTVIPPFWQTNWFRLLLALGLASVIAGGYRLRLAAIQARNRELEHVVHERTGELKKRNIEMEALYQADEKILRTVSLNQVFQTLVNVAVDILKADHSVVLAWDEEQTCVTPRVSFGFDKKTLGVLKFVRGEGVIGQVLETGQAMIEPDMDPSGLRPEVRAAILEEGIHSFAHLPIKVDEKVIAVFSIGFTRPNAVNEDIVRLYTALVQRASLSIANMELFEQTKDLAVMEERNRLARDLHDSAKQKAFAALAQLGTVNVMLKQKSDGINPHIAEAETLVYEVIQELNFLVQEIYPIALQEKGLAATLREYVFEWENRNDIEASLTIRAERPLPLETEQAVYRVIQEALANVSRHSHARRVEVSLVYNVDSLQVQVADDGCGFDMDQKSKDMGFRSMRERINSIRGTLQIQSAPGQGTRLTAQAPVKS
jgi:ligand-binding sensor domain-containing protein/signal transduction histidine kinase